MENVNSLLRGFFGNGEADTGTAAFMADDGQTGIAGIGERQSFVSVPHSDMEFLIIRSV